MTTLTLLSQKKIPVNNISFRTYMASELKFLFVRNYTYSLGSGMWQSGHPKSGPMIKQRVVFTTSQYCSILLCSSADTGWESVVSTSHHLLELFLDSPEYFRMFDRNVRVSEPICAFVLRGVSRNKNKYTNIYQF